MLFCRDRPMAVGSVFEICASDPCALLELTSTALCDRVVETKWTPSHLARLVVGARALQESDLNAEVQHPPVDVLIEARCIQVLDLCKGVSVRLNNDWGVGSEVLEAKILPHRVALALPSQLPAHLTYFREVLHRQVLDEMYVDVLRDAMERQALAGRARTNIALQALHGRRPLANIHRVRAVVPRALGCPVAAITRAAMDRESLALGRIRAYGERCAIRVVRHLLERLARRKIEGRRHRALHHCVCLRWTFETLHAGARAHTHTHKPKSNIVQRQRLILCRTQSHPYASSTTRKHWGPRCLAGVQRRPAMLLPQLTLLSCCRPSLLCSLPRWRSLEAA